VHLLTTAASERHWTLDFPQPQTVADVYLLDNEQRMRFVQFMTQYQLNDRFENTMFTLERFSWSNGGVTVELQEFVPQNEHFVQVQSNSTTVANVGAAGGTLAALTLSNWYPGKGLKRLVFTMQAESKLLLSPGFMHYQQGPITYKAQATGVGQPTILHFTGGPGQVFSNRFADYIQTVWVNDGTTMEHGLWVAAEGHLSLENVRSKAPIASQEGLWQTRVSGSGWVCLALHMPVCKLQRLTVTPAAPVIIHGPYALLWTAGVTMTTKLLGNSAFAKTKEGYVNVFEGSGEVLFSPTDHIRPHTFHQHAF